MIVFDGKYWEHYIRVFDVRKDQQKLDKLLNNPDIRIFYKNIEIVKNGMVLCVIEYLIPVKDAPPVEAKTPEEAKQIKDLEQIENAAKFDEFVQSQAIIFGKK
ncbi:MAG: hypothetical protein QXP66_01800 [Candidatus Aenigmatarchaeota archaeon]